MSATVTKLGKEENNIAKPKSYMGLAISRTIESLAMCIWLGGLLIIGAVVAPVTFHTVRTSPLFPGTQQEHSLMAGAIVGNSLRALNYLAIASFVLILIASVIQKENLDLKRSLISGWIISTFLITLIQTLQMFPLMDAYQASGNMSQFDIIHHLYVYLSYAQMLFLIIAIYQKHSQQLRISNGSI